MRSTVALIIWSTEVMLISLWSFSILDKNVKHTNTDKNTCTYIYKYIIHLSVCVYVCTFYICTTMKTCKPRISVIQHLGIRYDTRMHKKYDTLKTKKIYSGLLNRHLQLLRILYELSCIIIIKYRRCIGGKKHL